jgi:signal transduction histidine kinase
VIERAIGFIRLKHGRAGQPFQIVVAPSPVSRIRCDRDAMHQVLVNLMENAVQHRHPDRALVLQLELAADGPGCRLTMQDNGRGMPPEVRDRLFGRFVSGREGGTGLGLAIVRQIMIDHGGEIELGETSDQGTMFVLRLPGEAFSLKEAGQGGQGRKG